MPRRPSYHWDKRAQAYRTDTGGKSIYFRGVARDDHLGIAQKFGEHLAALDSAQRPAEPDVLDLVTAFLKSDRGIKPRTRRAHKERLTKFANYPAIDHPDEYGCRPAKSVKACDLRVALAAWRKAGHSPHYMVGVVRSVKAAWNWASSEAGGRIVAPDVFKEVESPQVARSPDRYAERPELAAFLRFVWRRADALPEGVRRRFARRLVLMLRVAAYTGARPGTLCSAWWSDFDPAKRTLTLPPDRHKTGHKTGLPLVLFLPPTLARALRRERERPGRHPTSIFTHERGKGAVAQGAELGAGVPWGIFVTLPDARPSFEPDPHPLTSQVLKLRGQAVARAKELKEAGKPTRGLELIKDKGANRFVMYRLRHTKASDDLMAGGNPATVAALLGTSVKMLETTYVHFQADHLSKSAADLSASARTRRPKPPSP